MGHEGPTLTDRRWLIADERGSIAAVTDGSGNALAINTYDEYGQPGAGNLGRFQYTGQAWMPELGLYHYKARFYDPATGRFLQTDSIGMAGGLNLYAYAGGDPVNLSDPSGLRQICWQDGWRETTTSDGKIIGVVETWGPQQCIDLDDLFNRIGAGNGFNCGGGGPSTVTNSNANGQEIAAVTPGEWDGTCRTPDGSQHLYRAPMGDGGPLMLSQPLQSQEQMLGWDEAAYKVALGWAATSLGSPTEPKNGGISGGGKLGKATSPLSRMLRVWMPGKLARSPLTDLYGTRSRGGIAGRAVPGLFGIWTIIQGALNPPEFVQCTPET